MKKQIQHLLKLLQTHQKTIILIITVATLTLLLSSLTSIWLSKTHNLQLPSIGTIYTIGVKAYWDPELTNETKEIQWGTLYPGTTKNVTLYLKSESNIDTTLLVTATNWTFNNSTNHIVRGPEETTPYMNLTSNHNQTILPSNKVLPVTFYLHVSNTQDFINFLIENDIKTFSFDIKIEATI